MAIEGISEYSEGLLKYYFEVVCEHLTGRKTRVVWQDVIRRNGGINGTVRKDGDKAIIILKRGLGWDQTYSTFLHECGHAKCTWEAIWQLNGRRERFPDFINKQVADKNAKPLEDSANKQAKVWASWARSKAGTGMIIPQLVALLEY